MAAESALGKKFFCGTLTHAEV